MCIWEKTEGRAGAKALRLAFSRTSKEAFMTGEGWMRRVVGGDEGKALWATERGLVFILSMMESR